MCFQPARGARRYVVQVQKFLKRQYQTLIVEDGKVSFPQSKEEVSTSNIQSQSEPSSPVLQLSSKTTIYIAHSPVNFKATLLRDIAMPRFKPEIAAFVKARTAFGTEISFFAGTSVISCKLAVADGEKTVEKLFYLPPHLLTSISSDYDDNSLGMFCFEHELATLVFGNQEDLKSAGEGVTQVLKSLGQLVEVKNQRRAKRIAQQSCSGTICAKIFDFYLVAEEGPFYTYQPQGDGCQVDISVAASTIDFLKDGSMQHQVEMRCISTVVVYSQVNQLVLELLNEAILILQFESLKELELFQINLQSVMSKLKLMARIRYYQINDKLRAVNYPLQSCVFTDYLRLTELLANAAFLLRNYPNSLPLEMKNKETVGITLQTLQLAESENEVCLLCDFLVFLISSRAMFIALVQQYYDKLLYLLNKLILGQSYKGKCMGTILLRNSLSFHFQCYYLGENMYYNGFQSSYSLGANYLKAFREFCFDPHVKNQNYELQQFSARSGIEITGFNQEGAQIDSTMIQSATFGRSRIEAERDNRIFFSDKKDVLHVLDSLVDNFEGISLLCQCYVMGILEDVLLSHHHLDAKYTQEEAKKSELYLPHFRREMTFSSSKLAEFLVHFSVHDSECLRQASQLILKTIIHENILYQQQKLDIVQIIMQLSCVMSYFKIMLNDRDQISSLIVSSLFGVLFHYSPVMQQMAKQVFYPVQIYQIEPIIIAPVKFAYNYFGSLFGNGYGACQLFAENIFQNVANVRIVWDQQVRDGITAQIDAQLAEYTLRFGASQQSCAWNYQAFVITHKGLTSKKFSQFDFAVSNCVLSQLVSQISDDMRYALQIDTTECCVQKYVLKQAATLPDGYRLMDELQDVDVQELTRCLFDVYVNNDDVDTKCAALYFMQPLFLLASAKAGFFAQFLHEIANSIDKRQLLLNFYELKMLELFCFQANQADPEKLMYWVALQKDGFISTLIAKLLPSVLLTEGFELTATMAEHVELFTDLTYGNLLCTILRIVRNCLQYVPCLDRFNQLLIPSPQIYQVCKNSEFMALLFNLVLISYYTKRQYENSNIEDYIYSQQKHEAPQSPVRRSDVDYHKYLFVACSAILRLLVQNDADLQRLVVRHGFVELLLYNPFDAYSNVDAFSTLKTLLALIEVRECVGQYLTFPFAYYLEKQKAASSANIFCCANYLSMNCIWSQWQRQWLQQQLCQRMGEIELRECGHFKCPDFGTGPHCKLEEYQFLRQYEQFRVHNMYICLLDIYWFTAIFQATSSDEIKFPSTQETQLLKSSSVEDNNVFRHQYMIKNMQNQISLEDIYFIMLSLLDSSTEIRLEQIQEIKFELIIDSPKQFVYQAFSYIINTFSEKLKGELVLMEQLFNLEQDLQHYIDEHKAKYGGTNKYVISKLSIQDPQALRRQREAHILIIAKIMLVMQKLAHSLYLQLQRFEEMHFTFEQLNNFFKLVNDVITCEFFTPFQQLMKYSTNYALSHDLQYCLYYIMMYNDFKLVMRESLLRFVAYIAQQLLDRREDDMDLLICYKTILSLTNNIVDATNYEKISCGGYLVQILLGFYVRRSDMTDQAIVRPTMELLANLSYFDEFHLRIMETALPYINLIAVFYEQQAGIRMLFNMRGSYMQHHGIKQFLGQFRVLSFCLQNSKSEDELGKLLSGDYFSEDDVLTKSVKQHYALTMIQHLQDEDLYTLRIDLADFLCNDCFIGRYVSSSLIGQYILQFPLQGGKFLIKPLNKLNYSAQLLAASDNALMMRAMLSFAVAYSKAHFEVQPSQFVLDIYNEAAAVPLLCALNIILELQMSDGRALSTAPDNFSACMLQFAMTGNNSGSEVFEQISVLAALILVQLTGMSSRLNEQFQSYYPLLFALLSARGSVEIKFEDIELRLANSPLTGLRHEINQARCAVQLPVFSRFHYLFYLATELFVTGAQMPNFELLALYTLLDAMVSEEDSDGRQFLLLSSLKALQKGLLRSEKLYSIIPRPLQYSLLLGNVEYVKKFLETEALSPCVIFSRSISGEFSERLRGIILWLSQQAGPTEVYLPASFFEFVASLNAEYYTKGMVVADVVLPLYLYKAGFCVPDLPQFVQGLVRGLLALDPARLSEQAGTYLRALASALERQPEALQLLAAVPELQTFLGAFLFDCGAGSALQQRECDLLLPPFFAVLERLTTLQEDVVRVSVEFIAQMMQLCEQLICFSDKSPLTRYNATIAGYIAAKMTTPAYRLPLSRLCYVDGVFCTDFFFRNMAQTGDKALQRMLLLGFSVLYAKSTDFQQIFDQHADDCATLRAVCTSLGVAVSGSASVLLDAPTELRMAPAQDLYKRLNTFSQEDLEIALAGYQRCKTLSATHHALLYGLTPSNAQQLNFPGISAAESVRLGCKCLQTMERGEGWSALSRQVHE